MFILLLPFAVTALFSGNFYSLPTTAAAAATRTPDNDLLLRYEWPHFMGDSSFTRFSAGPAPVTSDVLWKKYIPGIQSYITAFNGMVFVSTNTSVVALDKDTGEELWKTDIPMSGTWPVVYKIDEAHMVVESSCLDPKTGKILWTSSEFSADTGIFNANVYSPEEKLFFVKVDSYIEAWDFSDPSRPPTRVWRTYIPGGGKTGIGIAYGEGKVFPGSFQSHQMALDAKTGALLWDTPTKGPMIFSGSYYQGRFFRGGTDDNTMYCFNATNGEILWKHTLDTDGYFTVGTAVGYGMVYGLNKDGYLYAFNIDNGNLIWKYKGPGPLLFPGSPTVADAKVYATTGQAAQYGGLSSISEFVCLDAYTGRQIWKLPIEAFAPRESVAIAYGNLYLIPANVTTAVDSIDGSEYETFNEVWAIGPKSYPVGCSWPMWRHDPAHSSISQCGPSNLTLAWKFRTNGAVISSPSVANGIVYVGSQDKNLYAVGAWSGNLIWKFTTLSTIESSPAVANGKVFTGGDDGYVYCLDAYKGTLLWKTFINGNLPATFSTIELRSSPTVSENMVYIGSLDGYLYALNINNGHISWKFKTEGPITSSPAVAEGAVYITSQEPTTGALYKIDANNGDLIWKKTLPYNWVFTGGTDMFGSPSVAAGMVFASSNLREYYGINATTGEIIWTFTNPHAIEFIYSSPIYVDGQLFIINKFDITCLNATNGRTIWSTFTGDELYVSPSYADGKIYVVTTERHIYILDAKNNGTKIASFTTPSSSFSSPTLSYGRLYIGNNDWNIYCLTDYITYEEKEMPSQEQTSEYTPLIVAILVIVIATLTVLVYAHRKQNIKFRHSAKHFSIKIFL